MDDKRARGQDIRPLRIVILNLMPVKITTETDLIRLLSNSPLQLEVEFMKIKSHTPKNTPIEHMMAFYRDFEVIAREKYDGMIITGAPIEHLPFDEVKYWPEMEQIFAWARENVTSTLFICWAAQAGLHYYYGIPKYPLEKKLSGVYKHRVLEPSCPIFRGFDDEFFVPHSRYTTLHKEDILSDSRLTLLSESDEAGVYMVMARQGREFFITGHSEYAPNTLHNEYVRDVKKGISPALPCHYYPDNDPSRPPVVRWRSHANLLFSNWLNYYVYQETPYDISQIHS